VILLDIIFIMVRSHAIRLLLLCTVVVATVLLLPYSTHQFHGQAQAQAEPDVAERYLIGPEDVLQVIVWDNDDLTKKVSVGLDGYINFQFVGRVKASGLTANELSSKLAGMLSEGYIKNAHVTIQVVEHRSKKLFIIGEVHKPGTYYLTRPMTIVEAISMAQGPTNAADQEVIIVRQGTGPEGSKLTINLQRALEGDASQNIPVKAEDAIYISKAKTFFIMGEVHKPGQYKLEEEATVRKAISIAGGHTEKAALKRVKIIRHKNQEKTEKEVDLEEMVEPFDTIIVPQSYF